jgi:fatty-acyl-CoA synthase
LRIVFAPGDSWFRTGDLMRKDRDGYFFFVDRIGDTYRWKGENVATSEVSEAITVFPGVMEANVYGVAIPGKEGRVGMAALVVDDKFDMDKFRVYIAKQLPDYARPLFVRIRGEIEVTATFKHKKIDLVKQGFDPAATKDAIYFDDPQARTFELLDQSLYDRIIAGHIRI